MRGCLTLNVEGDNDTQDYSGTAKSFNELLTRVLPKLNEILNRCFPENDAENYKNFQTKQFSITESDFSESSKSQLLKNIMKETKKSKFGKSEKSSSKKNTDYSKTIDNDTDRSDRDNNMNNIHQVLRDSIANEDVLFTENSGHLLSEGNSEDCNQEKTKRNTKRFTSIFKSRNTLKDLNKKQEKIADIVVARNMFKRFLEILSNYFEKYDAKKHIEIYGCYWGDEREISCYNTKTAINPGLSVSVTKWFTDIKDMDKFYLVQSESNIQKMETGLGKFFIDIVKPIYIERKKDKNLHDNRSIFWSFLEADPIKLVRFVNYLMLTVVQFNLKSAGLDLAYIQWQKFKNENFKVDSNGSIKMDRKIASHRKLKRKNSNNENYRMNKHMPSGRQSIKLSSFSKPPDFGGEWDIPIGHIIEAEDSQSSEELDNMGDLTKKAIMEMREDNNHKNIVIEDDRKPSMGRQPTKIVIEEVNKRNILSVVGERSKTKKVSQISSEMVLAAQRPTMESSFKNSLFKKVESNLFIRNNTTKLIDKIEDAESTINTFLESEVYHKMKQWVDSDIKNS